MYLTRPVHTPEFLTKVNLGVEVHITRDDAKPNWAQYIPFVGAVHLPYVYAKGRLNIAAFDDNLRELSLDILKKAIDTGCQYKVDRMVMHPVGIEILNGELVGCYDRQIDGIQRLAKYAKQKNIILCVENQLLEKRNDKIYGVFADDWLKIYDDVNRDNVLLTLDTSHASTSVAMIENKDERFNALYNFLKRPEIIGRVHWSDSKLTNQEALYNDMHLVVGMGDLPIDFHKKIKSLPVIKTLEQNKPEQEMEFSLNFIQNL